MISNNDEVFMNHKAQRRVETETKSEMLFKMAQQLPPRNCCRNVPNSAWNRVHTVNSYRRGGVKSRLRVSDFYEGESISKLQMDVELKQIRLLI
jgi:hypothetical protein